MRIARELHDVVAHSMAMINVQATAAAVLLAEDPAGAAAAIQAIRGASKSGLRELRAILKVLREADTDGPGAGVPDLRDIRALADATTAAGTPVVLRAYMPPAPLPPPVALTAYRIVQESLTNVVRHADGATATVIIRQDHGHLLVEITNDSAPASTEFAEGTGTGLAGMRERAAALGGTLEAGPRADGGFVVRAWLPLASAAGAAQPAPADPERTASPEPAGSPHALPTASSP